MKTLYGYSRTKSSWSTKSSRSGAAARAGNDWTRTKRDKAIPSRITRIRIVKKWSKTSHENAVPVSRCLKGLLDPLHRAPTVTSADRTSWAQVTVGRCPIPAGSRISAAK